MSEQAVVDAMVRFALQHAKDTAGATSLLTRAAATSFAFMVAQSVDPKVDPRPALEGLFGALGATVGVLTDNKELEDEFTARLDMADVKSMENAK